MNLTPSGMYPCYYDLNLHVTELCDQTYWAGGLLWQIPTNHFIQFLCGQFEAERTNCRTPFDMNAVLANIKSKPGILLCEIAVKVSFVMALIFVSLWDAPSFKTQMSNIEFLFLLTKKQYNHPVSTWTVLLHNICFTFAINWKYLLSWPLIFFWRPVCERPA